jgi:hypothetical protein
VRFRIGQQDWKAVRGAHRDRHTGLGGHQRVTFSDATGFMRHPNYARVNLLHTGHRILIKIGVARPESMLQPMEGFEQPGTENAHGRRLAHRLVKKHGKLAAFFAYFAAEVYQFLLQSAQAIG